MSRDDLSEDELRHRQGRHRAGRQELAELHHHRGQQSARRDGADCLSRQQVSRRTRSSEWRECWIPRDFALSSAWN